MTETSPQRAYRAACPGCGAPVDFRSAQSTHAVCSYCSSTVVRQGETLARLGKMGEVFEDYSPLQLLAQGRWDQQAFTLVGRLQYRGGNGNWTEWVALLDDGRSAILGEDNGAYVFSLPATLQREVPEAARFRVGGTTAVGGETFTVAANDMAALVSAQGELPHLPPLGQTFAMVELRSAGGEVLSIDYGTTPPQISRGRAVRLEDLALTGLRADNAKEEKGRHFDCPACGEPVEVALAGSKSITCRSCNALIDLQAGIGGELAHALQDEPVQPLIPLGSAGSLQGTQWQVVGFQHRMGQEPDDPDEQFGWSEYLLYNQKRGFAFLVDAEDGWSLVKPLTGAPSLSSGGQSASYLGTTYKLQYSYKAETSYVAGEFYWPVVRGQTTFNRDFSSGNSLLSLEESPREAVWSGGNRVEADTVAKAFGLEQQKDLLQRADAAPTSRAAGMGCITIIVIVVIIIVLLLLLRACQDEDGRSGYTSGPARSSGGSWGGYSGGGGHK